MQPDECQFYARHFSLAEVGEAGQQQLKLKALMLIMFWLTKGMTVISLLRRLKKQVL